MLYQAWPSVNKRENKIKRGREEKGSGKSSSPAGHDIYSKSRLKPLHFPLLCIIIVKHLELVQNALYKHQKICVGCCCDSVLDLAWAIQRGIVVITFLATSRF